MKACVVRTFLVSSLAMAVCCVGDSSAVLPGGCVQQGEQAEAPVLAVHIAQGISVEGALHELQTLAPPGEAPYERPFTTFPVLLGTPHPYPLPFSQPVVMVTVGRTTDFGIDVTALGGGLIEKFEFVDVGPGVYVFSFEQPIWPSEDAVVDLLHRGSLVGRKPVATATLNRLK